ncbi:hypothetical protein BDZ97DRAFT_1806333 [Flammula alnicola]|nr:hypothetical protein BDZ97DRAFT_1806333 [Flammula alnicola]
MLLMQPWFKTCACENRNPVVANHICDNSELAAAQYRALYLSILNPSTGDSSLNRALTITEHAVNILMQFNLRRRSLASTMELIDGVFLSHPQKLAKNNFTAALLNCGAIAISHSDYSRSLVQTLITYRDPESELDMMDYPLQFLRTEVIKYLQRVEPEVEASDLLKLKNKWKYESSESRWYYAGVAVSPNASG